MNKSYISIFKKYHLLILTLGFAYGSTIIFTLFGPILNYTAGTFAPALSIIAVMFHVVGFLLKPTSITKRPTFFYVCMVILLPLVVTFHILPHYLQLITTMLYAYIIGRIGCLWTYIAKENISSEIRGKVISLSLFISFTILYFVHMTLPVLSKGISLLFPAVLSSVTVFMYFRIIQKYSDTSVRYIEKMKGKNTSNFVFVYIFLIVVYVAGGFTYTGIYPSFIGYAHIDRYYNVLFYLIAILIAGIILEKYGRKTCFVLGVGLLGISFTFFNMQSSLFTYFITQTFLQAGWAFVNAFGWSFSWDMAERSKNTILFSRGISAMLIGTTIGAISSHVINELGFGHSSVRGIVTFIPLFLAIMILIFFPETLKNEDEKIIPFDELQQIKELNVLTPRELEVCYQILLGLNNEDIGKALFISKSTVKTHVSRIFSKLYISSRGELKNTIEKYINENSIKI